MVPEVAVYPALADFGLAGVGHFTLCLVIGNKCEYIYHVENAHSEYMWHLAVSFSHGTFTFFGGGGGEGPVLDDRL